MKVKGKHCKSTSRYWTVKRMVSAVLSVALLMGCISFSALAWFRYEKRTNIQVFKGTSLEVGFIGDGTTTYPLIPGQTYYLTGNAIPKITLPANSVDCYIYALCEFYWYDFKYDVSGYDTAAEKQQHLYGYPLSSMYRETDVAHDPFNDTYRPNRSSSAAQGNDDDHGYIDYFGFQPDGSDTTHFYDTDSFLNEYDLCDIKDANGNIIGRRYLFGYRTTDNGEVFYKNDSDRFFYVLELALCIKGPVSRYRNSSLLRNGQSSAFCSFYAA